MGKGKPRHNPDKPQNNLGGDYQCINYDKHINGKEFCHNELIDYSKFWWQTDKNNKLVCKGNKHNCSKLKYKWFASITDNAKEKFKHLFIKG